MKKSKGNINMILICVIEKIKEEYSKKPKGSVMNNIINYKKNYY